MIKVYYSNDLYHHGIKGQRWGVRRYQNPDGSLTPEGEKRYGKRQEAIARMEKSIDDSNKNIARQTKVLNSLNRYGQQSREFTDQLEKKTISEWDSENSRMTTKTRYVNNDGSDDPDYENEFDSEIDAYKAFKEHYEKQLASEKSYINAAKKNINTLKTASLNDNTFLEAEEAGRKAATSGAKKGAIVGGTIGLASAALTQQYWLGLHLVAGGAAVGALAGGSKAYDKAYKKMNVKDEYKRVRSDD